MKLLIPFLFFSAVLVSPAHARPGPIEKATVKSRLDFLNRTRLVEVQRTDSHPAMEGYRVLATRPLSENQSRDLLTQLRQLPFERVTHAQCHEPGFALRLLDADKKLIAELSLCWKCRNLKATQNSLEPFREYQEDFAADSKRGKAFQNYLDGIVPKPR